MHFDNIEIIIKTAYGVEITHIFRYTSMLFRGWLGGAMVLGELPVPGRPTI